MKAVQILMDDRLLAEVDREARRRRLDRSKFVRAALQRQLAENRRQAMEEQHRKGYERHPVLEPELTGWEAIQKWPET